MPPPIARAARLRAELDRLGDAIGQARFALPSMDQIERQQRRDQTTEVVRSYLIPRLGEPELPLLVVVAGPTGSGKSTLVNSLAGRQVSRSGALRPTTREPAVWCSPRHADRYRRIGSVECAVEVDDHPLLDDLTLVDTPDLDSYVTEHRLVTLEVLRHADVVVFLTSAQRYADAVPWEVLAAVDRRGSPVVYVLNRLNRRASGALSDYGALLRRHGLAGEQLHPIQEQRVKGEAGLLPGRSVSGVSDALRAMAGERVEVLAGITHRATAHVVDEGRAVAADLDAQADERARLEAVVRQAYADALLELTAELDRGRLVRGEVVDRWSERVGSGEVARWMKGTASRARGLIDVITARPKAIVEEAEDEARRELIGAVLTRLDRTARAVTVAWEVDVAGRELATPDLRRVGEASRAESEMAIDGWLAGLTELVEREAPRRFRAARWASTGVNAAAVASILAVFAATGGITGAEMGVAAGAAAAQQGLLEHVLGKAAAGSLAGSARAGLIDSVEQIYDLEADRFVGVLESAGDPPGTADAIRRVADQVESRSEEFHAQ